MYLGIESRQLHNNENGLYSAPVVDYMNHDENNNASVMMDDQAGLGNGLIVYASRDIK